MNRPLALQRSIRSDKAAPPIVHEVLRSPGRPLDPEARAFMEPRFGHDFTHVSAHGRAARPASEGLAVSRPDDELEHAASRSVEKIMQPSEPSLPATTGPDFSRVQIHSDSRAAESARAVDALAYTVGEDIVFGAGRYAPGSSDGRRLLAHELTHVVQQRSTVRPPVLARVSFSTDDFNTLAEELHHALSGQSTDVPLIDVTLQKLERDSQAIKTLSTTYQTRYKTALDADLRKQLTGSQLSLALELLGIVPAGGATIGSAPGTPAQFDAAARRLNAALTAKTVDERAIIATLLPLGRSATRSTPLKAAYQTLTSRGLESDLGAKLSGTKLAYTLYLLNAPPPSATGGTFQTTAGTGTPPAQTPPAVEGGQVTALTGVDYPAPGGKTGSLSFAVTYTGGLASESRWLQFIWREIEVTARDGKKSMLGDPVTIGARTYNLTTQPTSPNYSVDSRSSSDPFYEASTSTSRREPNLTMIGDAPTPIGRLVAREYAAGASSVVSRAHFEIYLIRDYRTLYHIGVDVEHPFRDATHHGTNRNIRVTELASALPGPLQKALVQDYPAFSYIQ
jgi:hypothetical protein